MYLYTAIIIEPRVHPALELVLNNFINNLDHRWRFIIFHGLLNENYLLNIVNNIIYHDRKRITLIRLNINNLTINEYSMILMHDNIYKYIPTEMFLIFQTDTLISEKYKDIIYEFMEYDYVGAPFIINNIELVGNGGLSLRRKSKMLEIIRNKKNKFKIGYINIYECEDQFFCIYNNIKKPTIEKSKRFAIDSIYNDISFGIHKVYKQFDEKTLNKISKYIPEIYLLSYYNKDYNDKNENLYLSINEIFSNIKIMIL